jgi:biotin-dependent carboxylase-like uncharacterized protein
MRACLRIERAGPLTTIQDAGRPGLLSHGISASGPMDDGAFRRAGQRAGAPKDAAGIEFTRAGMTTTVLEGSLVIGWDGGMFRVHQNGVPLHWPGGARLETGDRLDITPGSLGNYGYLRFGGKLELPETLGSLATSMRAQLGGLDGRALRGGDEFFVVGEGVPTAAIKTVAEVSGPIRFIWGIHAERFPPALRERFAAAPFRITPAMDRMGVRLADIENVFAGASILSLVSDPVLPGDIQILGDGTPIVLMRDHQPTGGYPRIGTIITADLDRFAQMRAGTEVAFRPVTVEHAQRLMRSGVE